jgi:hypothetical protein
MKEFFSNLKEILLVVVSSNKGGNEEAGRNNFFKKVARNSIQVKRFNKRRRKHDSRMSCNFLLSKLHLHKGGGEQKDQSNE